MEEEIWLGAEIWPEQLRLLSMEPYSCDDWGEWREVDDGYGDTVSRPTCSNLLQQIWATMTIT